MAIGDPVTNNARRNCNVEDLLREDERITWGRLNRLITRPANGLTGRGLRPGSQVGHMLDNCEEIVGFFFAMAEIGCVSVPIVKDNPTLHGGTIETISYN
jgi:acyl-CoA synthetase (AMP-forming)/AMP-acid ligase II